MMNMNVHYHLDSKHQQCRTSFPNKEPLAGAVPGGSPRQRCDLHAISIL